MTKDLTWIWLFGHEKKKKKEGIFLSIKALLKSNLNPFVQRKVTKDQPTKRLCCLSEQVG